MSDPSVRQSEVLGNGPRIPPLGSGEGSAEQRALIAAMKPPAQAQVVQGADNSEWAAILARHPALFAAHMGLAQGFMATPRLTPRDRELAVLRLAWITGSPFEWGGHVGIAKASGVSAEEIARVIDGPDGPGWTALEAALLRATAELHADAMITDATWAVLAEELDEAQLIEFVMLIGHYQTVAYYQNALRFRLPAGNEGLHAR